MYKLYCLIIFFITYGISDAQTLNWEWAHSGNGNNFEKGNSICSDNSGNTYVTGFFSSPFITFNSISLINSGTWNAFIVKYDSTGAVLWAKSPVTNYSEGTGIISDHSGNIYMTGFFTSDSIIFDAITLYSNGSNDIFLTKFDSGGNVIWARTAGGQRSEQTNGICTDGDGNVLITGSFGSDSLVFDANIVYHGIDTLGGDIFIAKYDSAGNSLWARSSGGGAHDLGTAITSDQIGNVYATGIFASSSIYFGLDTLYNVNIDYDIFIVKYDALGNEQWALSAGSPNQDACNSITTDLVGNIYITGYFYGPSISFGNITLNSGSYDVFVVKIDSPGNFIWAKSSIGGGQEEGHGICSDILGNVYVTGFYAYSSVSFGSVTFNSANNPQLFLVKYDNTGNVLWGFAEGGNSHDFSNAICTNGNNNIFITGSFQSDSISFGTSTLYPIGAYDMFISKTGNISLGLINQNFDSFIHLFPNPITDKINITIKNNELSEIILYDIASRKLLQQKFTNSISLNTEQLSKGIYMYEVRNKNGIIKKGKVVKH